VEVCASVLVMHEDPVEEDDVEVNVQVEAATKPLHERDGAGDASVDAVEFLGSGAITREDDLDEDPTERGEDIGLERGEHA
jgi:hypothetical protein